MLARRSWQPKGAIQEAHSRVKGITEAQRPDLSSEGTVCFG
jgi:hypothetical protein